MGFPMILLPAFFVIILFVVALPAILIAIYHRVYQRYLNKALHQEAPHAPLASPHKVIILLTVAALFIGIVVSLFVGYRIAHDYFEESVDEFSALDLESYYAEVTGVDGKVLTVKGLSINEEKFRGQFRYEIWGETTIVRQGQEIPLSDLQEGDLVSIILLSGDGHVEGITDAFRITLLNDREVD